MQVINLVDVHFVRMPLKRDMNVSSFIIVERAAVLCCTTDTYRSFITRYILYAVEKETIFTRWSSE